VSCVSCKDTPKKEISSDPKPESKELIIAIEFITNKQDVFLVMLDNIVVDEFQKKNIRIHEVVPPSSEPERIVAMFGANNISNKIVINLGSELKEIQFNSIEFTYGINSIKITKDNYNDYLWSNKFIDFDEGDFSLKTKFVDGKHNPAIFSKQALTDFLKKGPK